MIYDDLSPIKGELIIYSYFNSPFQGLNHGFILPRASPWAIIIRAFSAESPQDLKMIQCYGSPKSLDLGVKKKQRFEKITDTQI